MDLDGTGKREARARVAAEEEVAPVVDLRREKAGLAATDAMWSLRIREMRRRGESVTSNLL